MMTVLVTLLVVVLGVAAVTLVTVLLVHRREGNQFEGTLERNDPPSAAAGGPVG